MSDYSFKIEEIQNPTIDPAVPNPYGAKSFETVKYHTPITPKENLRIIKMWKEKETIPIFKKETYEYKYKITN